MSSATLTITPSTSLVILRNVSTPRIVYLSNYNAPNFTVTIRDGIGLSTLQTSPVTISTIGSARFLDGTNSYLLNQPYGLVNLAFRNSSFWQVLHTSGQAPAASAADITNLTVSTSFFSFVSSASKRVSSLTVQTLTTTNSISLTSPFVITNLSAPGIIVVQSTLNVYDDVLLQKQLFVSGPTRFLSSLFVDILEPISSVTRVVSSVGVGGSLSVGGTATVLSTVHTRSTNFVGFVAIQNSTQETIFTVGDTLQVQNLVSSLNGLTVTDLFATPSTLTVSGHVSSLSALTTQSLNVRGDVSTDSNVSTLGNATFLSTLTFAKDLTVSGAMFISTNLRVLGNLRTSTLSNTFFSSLSSLSTSVLYVDTAYFRSGLSTGTVEARGWMSIGSDFYTPAVISSLQNTFVGGSVSVEKSMSSQTIHVSSSVGVGKSVNVRGDTSVGEALIEKSLSVNQTFLTLGYARVLGDANVSQNVFVDSNFTSIAGNIPNFNVNSFVLSNLTLISTTNTRVEASSILTRSMQITDTGVYEVGSTFASTTLFNTAIGEATRVNSVVASNFQWGPRQTSLSPDTQISFLLNADSFFPQGLSAMTIRADTLNTVRLNGGAFLGNGANISNVAVPFANLSAVRTAVSSFSTVRLFTSSAFVSSFTGSSFVQAVSSFVVPYFRVDSVGFASQFSNHQFLMQTPTTMVLNRGIYFNTAASRIGLNVSSPAFTLDTSGGIFASNVIFSTFTPLFVSSQTLFQTSSIYTSSTVVRDSLKTNVSGILVLASNSIDQTTSVFEILPTAKTTDLFGLYSYTSSIGINNALHIYNNTQRVVVNGLSSGIFLQPPYDLTAYNSLRAHIGYASSVNLSGSLQTRSLITPYLSLQSYPPVSTNYMSTTEFKLFVNNLITANNSNGSLGIKSTSPSNTLYVQGNAYFSSLNISGVPTFGYVTLGSAIL